MIRVLGFLAFLVLLGANAQDCIPESVGTVELELNYTLHWHASTNCEDVIYLVYIQVEDEVQYLISTEETFLDVAFLPACERFFFEVRAFYLFLLSEPGRLTSYVPAPSGADLTITSLTVSVQPDNSTFLNWAVTEKFAHCARAFRVVIRDSVDVFPRDIYTDRNNLFLNDLIPCGHYEFSVMAIYNLQSEGPINRITHTVPPAINPLPVLEDLVAGDTYVNITWGMPSYSVNRCQITSVVVDGLPFLYQTFPVDDSVERLSVTTNIGPLVPDNMYMLKVYVVSRAGDSDIYPIGVQTLPSSRK